MARGKDFVQMTQPPRYVAGDVQHENAVLSRHCFVKMIKGDGCQTVKSCIRKGLNGCGAREGFQNAHFAEKISGRKPRQLEFIWMAKVFADADQTLSNHKEPVSGFSFAHDDATLTSLYLCGPFPEQG